MDNLEIVVTVIGVLVVSGIAYWEITARKRNQLLRKVNDDDNEDNEEVKKKPAVIPYKDPIIDSVRGVVDAFRGRGIRGDYLHKELTKLRETDVNGSKDLRMIQTYLFGIHFLSTWDADIVREVLFQKEEFVGKQDFGQELNKRLVSDSILNVEGDEWKRQKKLLSPAFSYDHLKCISPEINLVTDILIEKLKPLINTPISLHTIMQKATLDIIGRSGFGINFGALNDEKKSEELQNYEDLITELQNPVHFFENIDRLLGSRKKLYKQLDKFESFMLSLVDNKRKTIEEKKGEYEAKDILDLLITGHDSEDGVLTDRQLIHNLNTFFIAGHETTAGGVSSTIHLLAHNPDCQTKLIQEIESICGDQPPTYDHLKDMNYLHNCIKEALRIIPPAPIMVRKIKKDIVLNGYHIPANLTVGLFTYVIHHDPLYWENPEQFNPDRFNDDNKDKRHRYAWIPFSLGPRQCIGNNLAFMEMKMMIIRFFQNFKVIPNPSSEKPCVPYMGVVAYPHPQNTILIQNK